MWRNYFTVGVRALVKNKTYAFINIFGLGVGLAACLMLLLYVRYETSYDSWLPNAENVYQFQSHYRSRETGEENHLQMTSYVAGQRLKGNFPQVERSVYALSASPVVMRGWLNGFDARIDLELTPFVLAGAIALAIAIGTIAGHAIKVARANPIHALRYE